MAVMISMMRGVNVGPHNRIKMDALCAIYRSLKLEDPRTYVQSGNVIFRTKERNLKQLSEKIQDAVVRKAGFRSPVVLRSVAELREAVAKNPFSRRRGLEFDRLLVSFLADEPTSEARNKLLALKIEPEELHLIGREVFLYFPDGIAGSKLQWPSLDKKLGTWGTARNWNSVTRILAMAEEMEAEEASPKRERAGEANHAKS